MKQLNANLSEPKLYKVYQTLLLKRWLLSMLLFTSFQIGKELYLNNWGVLLAVNLGLFIHSSVYFIYFRLLQKNECWIQLLYGLNLIVSFVFYWFHLGGIDGLASYFVFTLLIFFIVQFPVRFKLGVVLFLVFGTLFLAHYFPQGIYEVRMIYRQTVKVDFLLCCGLFAVVALYLKNGFDINRKAILRRNRKLDLLKKQLEEKRNDLTKRKKEVIAMSSYLERMIADRTYELNAENRNLEQYAYDNAHFLRGPLCNIKGVIELMKKEEKRDDQLDALSAKIEILDAQIYKVNNILN